MSYVVAARGGWESPGSTFLAIWEPLLSEPAKHLDSVLLSAVMGRFGERPTVLLFPSDPRREVLVIQRERRDGRWSASIRPATSFDTRGVYGAYTLPWPPPVEPIARIPRDVAEPFVAMASESQNQGHGFERIAIPAIFMAAVVWLYAVAKYVVPQVSWSWVAG